MTAAFPLDGRSPPSLHTKQNKQTKPQTSEAKALGLEASETKRKQLTSEEADKLAFQELKAESQNLAKEEAQKAKQQAQESGGVAQPQIYLRPSNQMGLAQLKLDRQDLLQHHEILRDAAKNTLFQLVNKFLIEPTDAQEIRKLNQVIPVMESLLDEFEDQRVVIQPRIDLPKYGSLDLLLRLTQPPNKVTFGIALRSQGDANIIYNEKKESFYIRRHKGRGGLYAWNPNHIEQLGEQEFWLRKNCREVFGESARDKNRPMVKLLVLTDNTKLGKHSENLYETIGDQKVLLLKKRCSVYVVEEEHLIPFLRAWIACK